jgi:putative membrane protein
MLCHAFGFGGMHWGAMIFMVLFWAVVIGLIATGARRMHRHGCCMHGDHGGNAVNIARERYAKGEISKEEFEQIKKDLS